MPHWLMNDLITFSHAPSENSVSSFIFVRTDCIQRSCCYRRLQDTTPADAYKGCSQHQLLYPWEVDLHLVEACENVLTS